MLLGARIDGLGGHRGPRGSRIDPRGGTWLNAWAVAARLGSILGAFVGPSCAGSKVVSPGLELPRGEVEAGRAAFVRLQCTACHRVAGDESLPAPTDIPVPFALGEGVASRPTDERLVNAIVHPNHVVRMPDRPEVVTPSGRSRMTDYAEVMRVQELIDLVAYLRAAYEGRLRR